MALPCQFAYHFPKITLLNHGCPNNNDHNNNFGNVIFENRISNQAPTQIKYLDKGFMK